MRKIAKQNKHGLIKNVHKSLICKGPVVHLNGKNGIAVADSKTAFVEAHVMSTIRLLYDEEPLFN